MRIKGLILLAVMIVVTVVYLAGENLGCSRRSPADGSPGRNIPAPAEKG